MRNVVEKKENALLLRVRFGQGNGNCLWSCCWAWTRTGIGTEGGTGGRGMGSSGSSCRSQQQQDIVPVLCAVADVTVITFLHKAHCVVIAKVTVLKPLTAVYIPAVSTVKSRYSERCSVRENISPTTKLSAGNRIESIFSSVSVFSFDRNRFEPKEARLISTSVNFLRFFPYRFRFH